MRKQNKKHFATVQHEESEGREDEKHYTFNSEEELDAFIFGMSEGYAGYHVIRTGAYHD